MDFKKNRNVLVGTTLSMLLIAFAAFVFALSSTPLLISPTDATWNNSDNDTQTFTFNFTDPDNATADCILVVNDNITWSNNSTNNATEMIIYSNESFLEGANTWYVNCTNITTLNSTINTLNIDTGAPVTATPTIAPTTAYTNDDLECNATLTDSLRTSLTAYYIWYKDDVINITGSVAVTNNSNVSLTLGSVNTTKNEEWICEITPNDGLNNGTPLNSTATTINNSIPTTTNATLTPTTVYQNTSEVTCNNASVTDIDNADTITWYYQWYVDNVTNVTTQTISNVSYSKDTELICEILASDGTNNSSKYNSTTLTVNNSIPTITTLFINTSYAKTGDSILISTTDAFDADGDNMTLFCGNTTAVYNLGNGNSAQPQINMSFTSAWTDDINHTIYCIVSDTENENSTEVTINVTADNTNPTVISFTTNDTDSIVRPTDALNFTVTVTDVNLSSVSMNGTLMANIGGNIYSTINTTEDFSCTTSGPCVLVITATDNVSNTNTTEYIILTVDNNTPQLTVTYPQPNMYLNGNQITLNGTFLDTNNVTASITSNNTKFNMSGDLSLGYWNFTNNTVISDGTYTIKLTANDSVGNENVTTITFTVDNTKPEFIGSVPVFALKDNGTNTAIKKNMSYYFNGSTVKLMINLTETNIYSVQANFSLIDGNNTLVTAINNSDGTYNITYNVSNISGINAGVVIITAIDLAGNYNNDTSFIVVMNLNPIVIDTSLGGSTTDWTTIPDFTNVSLLTFDKPAFGKIVFTETIDLTDTTTLNALQNLGTNMNFASANISLNSATTALSALNKSANLTMYNLSTFDASTSPGLLMDGVLAVSSNQTTGGTVTDVNWTYPNLTFSVTHWTSYYADGIAPTTTDNTSASWQNTNQTIALTCTDVGVGCNITSYKINTSAWNSSSLTFTITAEGNTTLKYYSNDTLNNTESIKTVYVLIDKTNPTITAFSISQTSVTVGTTVTGSCSANDTIDSTVTTAITGIDTSSASTKTVTCTATDDAGNFVQSSKTLEVTSKTTYYGGGGSSTLPPASNTAIWAQMTPNTPTIMKITKAAIGFTEITIDVINPTEKVTVTVKQLTEKPTTVTSSVSGNVYKYIEVETNNIDDNNVKSAKIKFKVEKSWLNNNNLTKNKVMLYRYHNSSWQGLNTYELSEDSDYIYYSADTPGFSYFVINAENQIEDVEDVITTDKNESISDVIVDNTTTSDEIDQPTDNSQDTTLVDDVALDTTEKQTINYLFVLILLLLAGVIVKVYVSKKAHTRKSKKKK